MGIEERSMKKMFTTKLIVVRKQWTVYGTATQGTQRGSGYCEDHFDRQYLTRVWKIYGVRIWSKIIDFEDVPVYASVQQATLGSTDWKSEFYAFI
jgi:hypothetical protein